MIVIWSKSAKHDTSQRTADQARLILKKDLFSDLEILEICGETHHELYIEREHHKPIETENLENKTITEPSKNINDNTKKKQKKLELIFKKWMNRILHYHP